MDKTSSSDQTEISACFVIKSSFRFKAKANIILKMGFSYISTSYWIAMLGFD